MTPQEGKPARHKIPSNAWLRKTADTTTGSLGLPVGSEVVVSSESQIDGERHRWEKGHPRNEAVLVMRKEGLAHWKKISGYHRRLLAETAIYRSK